MSPSISAVSTFVGDDMTQVPGEVLKVAFTKGDHATQPGGIVLRRMGPTEWVAHHFIRDKGSIVPKDFFWGRYCSNAVEGDAAFMAKWERVQHMLCTKAQIINEKI